MSTPGPYTCASCRDSGWIVSQSEKTEAVVPCPDCRKTRTTNRLIKEAGIPPRYYDRGLDIYCPQGRSQEEALKRAVEYVEAFPDVPRGLLLVGPPGVGKTHLSVAILKKLILEKRVAGKFIDETEFLRRLQYSYGPDSAETEREVLLPLMKVDLLVWDDLGTGRPTEWAMETIRTLLNHRYTFQKQTIFSTNWPLRLQPAKRGVTAEQTLSERIGHRLLSRIMEMAEIIQITGPDFRTEVHKARLDFEQSRRRADEIVVQVGRLQCEKCGSISVEERGKSEIKRNRTGEFVDVFCLCRECRREFIARVYPARNQVEYLKSLED
ncbi:MAG: ATP-binding protein [Acidobacteriota bacterium]